MGGWGASQLAELGSNCSIGVVRCIVCVRGVKWADHLIGCCGMCVHKGCGGGYSSGSQPRSYCVRKAQYCSNCAMESVCFECVCVWGWGGGGSFYL